MSHSKTTAHSGRPALRVGATDTGVSPDALVMTAEGALPAAYLDVGDRIITRRGIRRLRGIVRRNVPENALRVLVRSDALGGKPDRNVILMPQQRVLIRDWRAKTLWGRDIAAPAISRLVDGNVIRTVTEGPSMMISLYFGAPEVIYADGLELASADAIKRAPAPDQSGAGDCRAKT